MYHFDCVTFVEWHFAKSVTGRHAILAKSHKACNGSQSSKMIAPPLAVLQHHFAAVCTTIYEQAVLFLCLYHFVFGSLTA
jgi:hypothetical protein